MQWIAQAYGYKFTEREGNKGYTLNGNIEGKLCRFERGYPSRPYIRGIELRARAELDLPPDIAFLLVNRTLKMNVHNNAQSGFADSVMASVDIEQPEEVLWMNLFSEVGIPNASARFAADYAVLAEEEQHAQLLCQPFAACAVWRGFSIGAAHHQHALAGADIAMHLRPQRFRIKLRSVWRRAINTGCWHTQCQQRVCRARAGRPYSCFNSCWRLNGKG